MGVYFRVLKAEGRKMLVEEGWPTSVCFSLQHNQERRHHPTPPFGRSGQALSWFSINNDWGAASFARFCEGYRAISANTPQPRYSRVYAA